ncbi:OLC1v1021583C1 [Oldenlandia corymbosa var. corymbosa]|uniref:OLC1v1021583C1 n=1 Tax=Oldenlandia corymbosa var. corymbosa TaxID=529605 RepID=A0AAV1BYK7_OLDCO|nr:OLC1v1021583C1 [Oldenlandia corymbosa var. corymbosa]
MIAKTYGRRGGGMRKFGESFSQESSQDVYDFTLSSQGSTRWSSDPYSFDDDSADPYGLNNLSSQETDELAILPSRVGRGAEDFGRVGGSLWKSSKKLKIGDSEPCSLISSQDDDEVQILYSKKGGENGDSGYADGVFEAVMDLEPLRLNSSQESDELAILPVKKNKNAGKVDGSLRKSKKVKENGVLPKKNKKKVKSREDASNSVSIVPTSTLMETQEFGEMMEHVDEVDFALDGLRKGQPVRIRRGSLLSLLSISGTAAQRRMLRAHGMAKTIIDAVMGLSLDDSPSNLAAAALFYVLTHDGYDDSSLDLASCIRFLMKLLRPFASEASKRKEPTLGSKLLAIRMDPDNSQTSVRGSETPPAMIMKVHEVLVSCKDLKPRDENDCCTEVPELNPKWISLLTMEKACFSTISIEETSGRVRRTGQKFKEKLREVGGLDAVFEVARSCHSVIEGWMEKNPSPELDYKDKEGLESLVVLLKCLKIMENATFLSGSNQSHLLGMKGNFDGQKAPRSFIKLILSVIKILSGIFLRRSSLVISVDGSTCTNSSESGHLFDHKVNDDENPCTTSSTSCCALEGNSSVESLSRSLGSQGLISGHAASSKSSSPLPNTSRVESWLKMRINSSSSGSRSGKSGDCSDGTDIPKGFNVNFGRGSSLKVLDGGNSEPMDDSQDPFAFDEDDFEPSKWDMLAGSKRSSQTNNTAAKVGDAEIGRERLLLLDQEESRKEDPHSSEASCSSTIDNELTNLLSDCLLSAVKVLMNLTNDNPMGCQQIAVCGGLEVLSSLIASHYPNFSSCLPASGSPKNSDLTSTSSAEVEPEKNKHLSDQELDLLVAILGLLVNLVEKDSVNRTKLVAVRVPLRNLKGLVEESTDLIPLLCSIFLANHGIGEAADGKCLSWDDEDAVLQGEKEAEKMILEAYAALLLAFLSTERLVFSPWFLHKWHLDHAFFTWHFF